MRSSYRFFFVIIIFLSQSSLAQDTFTPYYVVIGGFKSEENARKYCNFAQEQNLPAVYAFNEERKVYYVYVRATQTKDIADGILARLRSNSVFKDAWVFNGRLSGSEQLANKPQPPPKIQQPPVVEEPEPDPPVVTQEPVQKPDEEGKSAAVPETSTPVAEAPKPVGRPFVFKLINNETGSVVNGLVRLQESEKAMQFRGFNGNEKVYVPAPGNRSGKWFVVCHVMGFRETKKPVVYSKAAETDGASVGPDQEMVIPIQLERVRKGDYMDMEAVKFYNNAALFTPGSERELNELVAMMEENEAYHIRLHGHTNGNEARDIVSLGEGTDFFTRDASNAKGQVGYSLRNAIRVSLPQHP